MRTLKSCSFDFNVRAEAEPQVVPRILELFALRSLVPTYFYGRLMDDGGLCIDISVSGLDIDQASHIAAQVQNIVLVASVIMEKNDFPRTS